MKKVSPSYGWFSRGRSYIAQLTPQAYWDILARYYVMALWPAGNFRPVTLTASYNNNYYKQVWPSAALASLYSETSHKWRGSVFIVVERIEPGTPFDKSCILA